MADKGIIFSGPMIRAMLDGRKTQTRRLLTSAPKGDWHCDKVGAKLMWVAPPGSPKLPCLLPYAIGDRLYVREHWKTDCRFDATAPREISTAAPILTLADSTVHTRAFAKEWGKHRQGMHMPRWASRLWLAVTNVRVQRLQDCSEADAVAEGIERSPHGNQDQWLDYPAGSSAAGWLDSRESYRSLWNSLHTAEGATWDVNPWVVAVSFDVNRGNIDSPARNDEAARGKGAGG